MIHTGNIYVMYTEHARITYTSYMINIRYIYVTYTVPVIIIYTSYMMPIGVIYIPYNILYVSYMDRIRSYMKGDTIHI